MRGAETSYRGTSFSERMADAPCRENDPDLSFPKGSGKLSVQHEMAKADCARCPLVLREECLELALKTEGSAAGANRYGVFGGLDPDERAKLAKARRQEAARPHSSDHGTAGRAAAHRRAGETPCGACLEAETAAGRERYRNRAKAVA